MSYMPGDRVKCDLHGCVFEADVDEEHPLIPGMWYVNGVPSGMKCLVEQNQMTFVRRRVDYCHTDESKKVAKKEWQPDTIDWEKHKQFMRNL